MSSVTVTVFYYYIFGSNSLEYFDMRTQSVFMHFDIRVWNSFISPVVNILILFTTLFIFNCNRVDTRWQQYSTHLHTNDTQNTEKGTYITIKRKK
jgi:hypothetical protein